MPAAPTRVNRPAMGLEARRRWMFPMNLGALRAARGRGVQGVVAVGLLVPSLALAACGSSDSAKSSTGGSSGGGSVSGKKVTIVGVADSNPWAAVYNRTIKDYLGSKGAK